MGAVRGFDVGSKMAPHHSDDVIAAGDVQRRHVLPHQLVEDAVGTAQAVVGLHVGGESDAAPLARRARVRVAGLQTGAALRRHCGARGSRRHRRHGVRRRRRVRHAARQRRRPHNARGRARYRLVCGRNVDAERRRRARCTLLPTDAALLARRRRGRGVQARRAGHGVQGQLRVGAPRPLSTAFGDRSRPQTGGLRWRCRHHAGCHGCSAKGWGNRFRGKAVETG
mmetsp:Transcript_73884/g.149421  ORF Transcript_73884/g.149421 Transcript_73884/m.149421 type:complete len:225 (-) Transcript_73884:237-911(-)